MWRNYTFITVLRLYVSYLAQDCSVNMTLVMVDDSGKVKKMTAGRAKAYAPVNMVLHLFAVETVLQFQQMLQIKEIGFFSGWCSLFLR